MNVDRIIYINMYRYVTSVHKNQAKTEREYNNDEKN